MGLYSRLIFPRLCDWSMRNPRMAQLRREVLSEADGDILEIGFGTGLNLEHYPEHVRHLTAVDPGVGMSHLARQGSSRAVSMWTSGCRLPRNCRSMDGQFDCVVSTWTLCSIPDGQQAVAEIGRVLRARRAVSLPGARLERRSWHSTMAAPPDATPETVGRRLSFGLGY